MPTLLRAINDISNTLKDTRSTLDNTNTELSNTKTELGKTKTELSNTKTDLSNAKTELNNAKAELKNKINSSGGTITGNLTVNGTLTASKVYNAVYNDYAELFEKNTETEFSAGDIVALDESSENERYIKARPDSKVIVGVCTDEYAHIIGGQGGAIESNFKDYVPVSLAGRVHVNVCGNVDIGDKITVSDIPGVGRKANAGEQVVGTALTKAKNGKVRILVGSK